MIFCGVYLLIVSTFVYLALNRYLASYWFFEIYVYIKYEGNLDIPLC